MQMKRSLYLATVLATTSLAARANAATTVDHEKAQGSSVQTFFSGSANIKCSDQSEGSVFALGFITGNETMQKTTGSGPVVNDGVFVEVDEYFNSCTGSFASGFGTISGGYHRPNQNLTSARLKGSTSFQDFGSGEKVPVTMNLTIRGTGPLVANKGNTVTHGNGPMTVIVSHTAASSREGSVTGTLSIGGVELDATFDPASMFTQTATTITVEKN